MGGSAGAKDKDAGDRAGEAPPGKAAGAQQDSGEARDVREAAGAEQKGAGSGAGEAPPEGDAGAQQGKGAAGGRGAAGSGRELPNHSAPSTLPGQPPPSLSRPSAFTGFVALIQVPQPEIAQLVLLALDGSDKEAGVRSLDSLLQDNVFFFFRIYTYIS